MHRQITALILLFASLVLSGGAAASLPVPYGNLYPFTLVAATNWNGDPAGANHWNCKPNAEHPYPVVLVNSTFLTASVNWTSISPYLRNRGHCVFAFNYGRQPPYDIPPGINGIGPVADSAQETKAFIERVLAATGARKVDIVGHSQGGVLPRYVMQHLGGADDVHRMVLLSSPFRIDTAGFGDEYEDLLYRLLKLVRPEAYQLLADIAPVPSLAEIFTPYFWDSLNAVDHGLAHQVDFMQITSKWDEMYLLAGTTPPVGASNARTYYVQDAQLGEWAPCLADFSTHFAIPYTRRAVAMIGNALDPAHAVDPPCDVVPFYSP